MRRAIALSRKGFPAPNPRVGCVITRGGRVVAEGHHDHAGGPHAEAVALRAAGASAKGATVYVTLEPCNHRGRTPQCADALIEAGVSKVVFACEDPNPMIAGGGAFHLRRAGLEVESGLLAERAAAVNSAWLAAMRMRRPFIAVKAAISLDGRTALPSGESKWITGQEARQKGRALRAEYGAVLVGATTVSIDDPRLTCRVRNVRNEPLRIVLDPHARTAESANVYRGPGEFVRIVAPGRARSKGDIEIPFGDAGFDLAALAESLWLRGVSAILVEGGAKTASSFLRAGMVDRIELFVAPKVLGAGMAWADGFEVPGLGSAPRFEFVWARRAGEDLWIRVEPVGDAKW